MLSVSCHNPYGEKFKNCPLKSEYFYTGYSGCQASPPSTNCQAGWSAFNGKCYKYFSEEKTWEEAQNICRTNTVRQFWFHLCFFMIFLSGWIGLHSFSRGKPLCRPAFLRTSTVDRREERLSRLSSSLVWRNSLGLWDLDPKQSKQRWGKLTEKYIPAIM